MEEVMEEVMENTHENHPIPQPKQGRGLSKVPGWKSSASLIRVYLPFSGSAVFVACPASTRIVQYHNHLLAKKISFLQQFSYNKRWHNMYGKANGPSPLQPVIVMI